MRNRKVDDSGIRTTLAVRDPAKHISCNFEDTAAIVARYVDDNHLMHPVTIEEYKARGKWMSLAKTLQRDLNEIAVCIPHNLREHQDRLRCVIKAVIADNFDVNRFGTPDEPEMWDIKDTAVERKKKREEDARNAGLAGQDQLRIAKIAKELWDEEVKKRGQEKCI